MILFYTCLGGEDRGALIFHILLLCIFRQAGPWETLCIAVMQTPQSKHIACQLYWSSTCVVVTLSAWQRSPAELPIACCACFACCAHSALLLWLHVIIVFGLLQVTVAQAMPANSLDCVLQFCKYPVLTIIRQLPLIQVGAVVRHHLLQQRAVLPKQRVYRPINFCKLQQRGF